MYEIGQNRGVACWVCGYCEGDGVECCGKWVLGVLGFGSSVDIDAGMTKDTFHRGQMIRFWSQLFRYCRKMRTLIPTTSDRNESGMTEGFCILLPAGLPHSFIH